MPVEFLQFGGLAVVVLVVVLLWLVFVYRARRTGEGDGTPKGDRGDSRKTSNSGDSDEDRGD